MMRKPFICCSLINSVDLQFFYVKECIALITMHANQQMRAEILSNRQKFTSCLRICILWFRQTITTKRHEKKKRLYIYRNAGPYISWTQLPRARIRYCVLKLRQIYKSNSRLHICILFLLLLLLLLLLLFVAVVVIIQ